MDVQEAIKNAPLFAQLSKKDIKQLAATMNPRSFPAGAVIIEKGKPGVGFFVIASGSATVTVKGDRVRTLKAGDHFGEIALIDDGPRMAEVTADTDLECYALAAYSSGPSCRTTPTWRGPSCSHWSRGSSATARPTTRSDGFRRLRPPLLARGEPQWVAGGRGSCRHPDQRGTLRFGRSNRRRCRCGYENEGAVGRGVRSDPDQETEGQGGDELRPPLVPGNPHGRRHSARVDRRSGSSVHMGISDYPQQTLSV